MRKEGKEIALSEAKAPDYTAPILGVREWIVQGKYLRSTNQFEIWRPGEEKTATCATAGQGAGYYVTYQYVDVETGLPVSEPTRPQAPADHTAPVGGCGCGLYAYYDRKYSEAHGDNISKTSLGVGVGGVVSAWGDVILCDYGFKAQHMKLEAIFLEEKTIEVFGSPVSISAAYRRLAERYGVPLILPAEFKAFSKEIGGVVLSPPERHESTETVEGITYSNVPVGWRVGFPSLMSGPMVLGQLPSGRPCNCAGCYIFNRQQRQTTYKDWRDKTKDIRERRS